MMYKWIKKSGVYFILICMFFSVFSLKVNAEEKKDYLSNIHIYLSTSDKTTNAITNFDSSIHEYSITLPTDQERVFVKATVSTTAPDSSTSYITYTGNCYDSLFTKNPTQLSSDTGEKCSFIWSMDDENSNIFTITAGIEGDMDTYYIYLHKADTSEATLTTQLNELSEASALTLSDKEAVTSAKSAYDALTDTQKTYMQPSLVQKLTDAETKIADLEAEKAAKEAINATVTADAQGAGAYMLAPTEMKVNAYKAESYGYDDTVADSVSTLDVLVAETEKIFGSDFTKDTASTYLAVADGGWMTTIFGEQTSACGFYLNDVAPSTVVNATKVANGDKVTFFLYQDATGYSDRYVTYKEEKLSAETGANVTLTVEGTGYDASWTTATLPLVKATVGYLTIKNGAASMTKIGETDSTGKITFTAPAAGSYTIVTYGKDVNSAPIVMNTIKLTVTKKAEKTTVDVKTGTTFTVNGYKYKVTSNLIKSPTVTVIGYKNKKLKSIKVASTVTYKKVSFKVTAIANSAFKNQKKAKSAVIGKNVKTIGSKAFYGDKKLKKITVKTSALTKVGSKAFKGIYKKAVIKVPSKKFKAYKKLMKNKGQKKTVKIKK